MTIKIIPRIVLGCSLVAGCAMGTLVASEKAVAATAATPTTLSEKGLPPIWLQGEPITKFEKDHLYVFEFWATWCGPCIAQMPHLEALHQQFKDDKSVTIVGVNVFDPTPEQKLKDFIKSKKVTYSVAADGSAKGPAAKFWLEPLKVEGIPHAVAVRNGQILWAGHAGSLSKELITKMSDTTVSTASLKSYAEDKKQEEKRIRNEFFALVDQLRTADETQSLKLISQYSEKKEVTDNYIIKAYWEMFNINIKKDNNKLAQKALEVLAEKMPKSALAQMTVGSTIVCTDDLLEKNLPLAIQCLERAIEIEPKRAELCYKNIADAKLMLGDREGAIKASELAIRATKSFKKMEALKSTLTK